MSVQSSNLEAIVRQSTWRYNSDGQAIKDRNGNEIAFFNQKRQKSFFGQMENAFQAAGCDSRGLSNLIKELKKQDISAEDMYQLMEKYTAFVQNPADNIKFTQLKSFLQGLKGKDYTQVEVSDLAASALEDKDKTNHLPQELRLSLSALPENVQEQFRNLTPEQLNMLNELSSDRTFLATLLRDARNPETQFNFTTWVQDHVGKSGDDNNKTYTFKQTEYVPANDGRADAPSGGGQSLVDQVLNKIKIAGGLTNGQKAQIKNFLSSTNVPLELLTNLNTTHNKIAIVLDDGVEKTSVSIINAIMAELNVQDGVTLRGEVTQTALGMKYHEDDKASDDMTRFFDSVLTTTPETLTDLDAQYRRVYGQSLDEMLNLQYATEFDAQYKGEKSGEKYVKAKNKYVTKHVQDFKTKFPELQRKFKDVYRNLKEQYDNFDSVISELQTKDPEQFNRLKSKYYQDDAWNKDLLYRDILTKVTGSDATVDRSRRTGFLGLGKSYGEETEHYSRMHFFSDGENGEIKTSTLKALGFAQDSQIDWGKVAKDAALGSVLGLASMATFGISSQVTNLISEWTNTSTTLSFTKTNTLRDAIYENGMLLSPEELIKGERVLDGTPTVETDRGSSGPQRVGESRDYGRAAIGIGSVAILGALHSIVNQLKNNNEVDITNGWNGAANSAEITQAVTNAIKDYKQTHKGDNFKPEEMRAIAADALCNKLFGDGHSVKNYGEKYDLMATITKFYIDNNGTFYGNEMAADCFSNSSNKLFSPDEAQALIAQLMQRGPSKPTQVRIPLEPQTINQIAYDINEAGLVNQQAGQELIEGSIQAYEQRYSAAWAKDDGVLTRNSQSTNIAEIRSAQTTAKGNITAQAVVSSSNPGQRIEVTPRTGTNGLNDFEKPEKVVIKDLTNDGYIHVFTYKFSKDENGETIYVLDGPVLEYPANNLSAEPVDIRKKQLNGAYYTEEYRLSLVTNDEQQVLTELDNGNIVRTTVKNYEYNFLQDKDTYQGYDISSIDYGRYSEHGRRRGR